jgi:hypothetical protein
VSKNDEYRANAIECRRMAEMSKNERDKQTWLEMAEHWHMKITPTEGAAEHGQEAEQPNSGINVGVPETPQGGRQSARCILVSS